MTSSRPITCPCGNPRATVKGYFVCAAHCDTPCSRKPNVCSFCRNLTKVT